MANSFKISSRRLIFFLAIIHFLAMNSFAEINNPVFYRLPPDTVPPPPPEAPGPLTGPAMACVGQTSAYSIDVPVACSCQWSVNGIPQTGSGSPFEITWEQLGEQWVSVVLSCPGGGQSEPETMLTLVMYQPDVYLGNDTAILQGQSLILDAGNPGSEYLWSTGETAQTISVSTTGTYSVNVSNFCGTDSDEIEVSVYVGIDDAFPAEGCFTVRIYDRRVGITPLISEPLKFRVYSMAGALIYEGPAPDDILLPGPGIYLVRGLTSTKSCSLKIIVP